MFPWPSCSCWLHWPEAKKRRTFRDVQESTNAHLLEVKQGPLDRLTVTVPGVPRLTQQTAILYNIQSYSEGRVQALSWAWTAEKPGYNYLCLHLPAPDWALQATPSRAYAWSGAGRGCVYPVFSAGMFLEGGLLGKDSASHSLSPASAHLSSRSAQDRGYRGNRQFLSC